jgi:hypothetical protein
MNKIKYSGLKSQILICFLFLILPSQVAISQYPVNYQYTLLPEKVIDQIIVSASGELAMLHVNNLAPYSRPRRNSELPGNLAESDYVMGKLREYGIRKYSLDTVGHTFTWQGIEGSVWEVGAKNSKIADYNDVPEMLAEGSRPADVRAKLIWAGEGDQSFFEGNRENIKGKIVVTSGNIFAERGCIIERQAIAQGKY